MSNGNGNGQISSSGGGNSNSCIRCHLDYLTDKIAVQEIAIIRFNNTITYSQNSQEVADVQRENATAIRDFRGKWNGGRRCQHAENTIGPPAEEFVPDQLAANSPGIRVEGGNLGLNTVASRAFQETDKPRGGRSPGRPPGSRNRPK